MGLTVAEVMADEMLRQGVDHVFGQSLPTAFLLACEERHIRQVVYRTENAGGAMADGYARIARRPAVVAAQNGPAATLLVPPLSEAMASSVPIVAIVQDVPTGHRDRNAFQELDHARLFVSCTKWLRRLDDPERAAYYVDRAFTVACSGRPGPVVLLVPKDVLSMPAPATDRPARSATIPLDRPRPAAEAVAAAAGLLAEARRPVVIAGGGVHLSGAADALATLQREAGLPVATTVMGKGAVAEDDPLSLGVMAHFMGPGGMTHTAARWLADADVVLLVGTRTGENSTDTWRTYPAGARYVHLDLDAPEIGRNYEALRLVGDARAGLVDLLAALRARPGGLRSAAAGEAERAVAHARADHRHHSADHRTVDATPIRPERVMAELDRSLTEQTIVVADASYSSVWATNYLYARHAGHRFVTPRGLAGLGWGLPMALGAACAHPGAPVVCVTGDGGFAHCWAELETAVRERLPVVVLVLNNALLGYQKHAEIRHFGAATSAVHIDRIDHTSIARACGAGGETVSDPTHLADALTRAFSAIGPVVLDIAVDPDAFPPLSGWGTDTRPTHAA